MIIFKIKNKKENRNFLFSKLFCPNIQPYHLHHNASKTLYLLVQFQNITISVQESVLHISGANGQVVQIYNVAGVMVKSIKVEGNDRRIELNLNKGCYIVKVGKVVRKISIK